MRYETKLETQLLRGSTGLACLVVLLTCSVGWSQAAMWVDALVAIGALIALTFYGWLAWHAWHLYRTNTAQETIIRIEAARRPLLPTSAK